MVDDVTLPLIDQIERVAEHMRRHRLPLDDDDRIVFEAPFYSGLTVGDLRRAVEEIERLRATVAAAHRLFVPTADRSGLRVLVPAATAGRADG